MTLKPATVEELTKLLADASARGEKISGFDLSALHRLVEHKAEDMTASVEPGMTLAELQTRLATRGQWLPIDPPNAEQLTIVALLATNVSGPRRFGFGTIRDFVIGLQVVLADGRIIHSGGKVVKNVAGYDLMKLFIGSHGSLGVIVEVTFKLRPIPETEQFLEANCASLDEAEKFIEAVLSSELQPMVLDLHNLSPATPGLPVVVLGFAGTLEEVEWQLSKAAAFGFKNRSSLDYDKPMGDEGRSRRVAVLPSKTIEIIRTLNGVPYVARAGNGIICHGSTINPKQEAPPNRLAQRLKHEFDPKHILPELPS